MHRPVRTVVLALSCALLAATPLAVRAEDQFWAAAADDHLDGMRGGFAPAPGLVVSFGIVRTVELNGAVVASTSFQINDLRSISAAQGQQLAQAAAAMVVQKGLGNAVTLNGHGVLPITIVQNTLNDQKIRTITQIDAVTNGMSLLKGMNTLGTLTDALSAAIRH